MGKKQDNSSSGKATTFRKTGKKGERSKGENAPIKKAQEGANFCCHPNTLKTQRAPSDHLPIEEETLAGIRGKCGPTGRGTGNAEG